MSTDDQQAAAPASNNHELLDVCVPRKKRVMKSQPRRIQSSIDVLAEVLAERFARSDSDADAYDPEEDPQASDDYSTDENEDDDPKAAKQRNLAADNSSSSKKRAHPDQPFKFTKCKLKNRHFLREGQGLAMIRSLGLEQFLVHTEVPRFNKGYCTEFITTYNHQEGCGVVEGRTIKITAEAVRRVTGLPLGSRGDRSVVHDVRTEDLPVMDRLIPGLKRTSYGYDLRYLRYKDQTETFVAVASALSEKLVCRTFKLTYIKGAIVLAMENSLRLKILMQWADFMAETIKNAIKLTKLRTRNVRFAFGEWLTGMIEHVLAEDLEGDKGTAIVESDQATEKNQVEVADASVTERPTSEEALPLVVHNPLQPQKFKKRVRTSATKDSVSAAGDDQDVIKRLRLELEEAEGRERWFVRMNVGMVREVERLRLELEAVKEAARGSDDREAKRRGDPQMVVKVKEDGGGKAVAGKFGGGDEVERMMERLQKRSLRHEEEVLRLKQEVEEQKSLIEVMKKNGFEGSFDESTLRREQKRLRREWEKGKLESTS